MDPKTKQLVEACEAAYQYGQHDNDPISEAYSDINQLCSAVREQDKRARHAEEERDAFDKRIAELEAQLRERSNAADIAEGRVRLLLLDRADVIKALAPYTKSEDSAVGSAIDAAKKITELEAERDESRDWVRRLTQETRVLTCAFCGEAYPPNTPESNHGALVLHVKTCAKHPMREVEKELGTVRGRLAGLEKACEQIVNLRDEVAEDPTTICNRSLQKLDTEIVQMSVLLP